MRRQNVFSRSELIFVMIFSMAAVAGVAYAQQAPIAKGNTLALQAGLVMQNGDVKPIARQDFYLLDSHFVTFGDLGKVMYEFDIAHYAAKFGQDGGVPFPALFCGGSELARRKRNDWPEYQQLCEDFQKHTIASTVSDFGGKGTFVVPSGTYYLFSHSVFGRNQIVWCVKVDLTSDQSVILDNRNALAIQTLK